MVERQLSILLIDDDKARADALKTALAASRYQIIHLLTPTHGLLKEVDKLKPDIIVIDIESPSRDILDSLHTISNFAPKPIVMFSDEQDTEVINQSVRSGVSAYVVGDADPTRVRSILDAAVARFSEYQKIRQELDDTKSELQAHRVINQAKRSLMASQQLSEDEAYNAMRKMAMDSGQKLEAVARTVLSLLNNLDLKGSK